MKIKNSIIEAILEFIVACTIIINTNTVWARVGFGKFNQILFYGAIFLLLIFALIGLFKNKNSFFRLSILLLLLLAYNLVFILFNANHIMRFCAKFIFILFPLIIYHSYKPHNNIMKRINDVMYYLSIISLIFYVGGSLLNIISPSSTVFLKWGYDRYIPSYYNLHYETQYLGISGMRIIRNSGVFTEAPMFSFSICIALALELFIVNKTNYRRVYIYLLTIFTTLSTIGIVAGFGMILIDFIKRAPRHKIHVFLKIIILPTIIYIALTISIFFITERITESNNFYGSYSVRLDDFFVGVKAWSNNIIFGHGYERHDLTQQYMDRLLRGNDIGGSSGLMMVLPQGGIWLLALYTIPLFIACIFGFKNNINIIIFTLFVTFLFTLTNIPYTYLMLYLLSIGWSLLLRLF